MIVSNDTVIEEPQEEFVRNYFCSSEACALKLGQDFCGTDECVSSLERLSNDTIDMMFFKDLDEVDITEVQEEIIKDIEESFNNTSAAVDSSQVETEIQ